MARRRVSPTGSTPSQKGGTLGVNAPKNNAIRSTTTTNQKATICLFESIAFCSLSGIDKHYLPMFPAEAPAAGRGHFCFGQVSHNLFCFGGGEAAEVRGPIIIRGMPWVAISPKCNTFLVTTIPRQLLAPPTILHFSIPPWTLRLTLPLIIWSSAVSSKIMTLSGARTGSPGIITVGCANTSFWRTVLSQSQALRSFQNWCELRSLSEYSRRPETPQVA